MSHAAGRGRQPSKDRNEGRLSRTARRSTPPKTAASPSKPPTSLARLQTTAGNRAVEALVRAAWRDRAADVISQAAVSTVVGAVLDTLATPGFSRSVVSEGRAAIPGGRDPDAPGMAELDRDTVMEGIGVAKRAVLQVTDITDTSVSVGGMYQAAKEAAIDATLAWARTRDLPTPSREAALNIVDAATKGLSGSADSTTPATSGEPHDVHAAGLPKNSEPIVWVRAGKGTARGTYYPEGSRYFGTTKSGAAMPLSEAERLGFRPAGKPHVDTPIEPRRKSRRQIESRGAGPGRGARVIAATTKPVEGVEPAIRPDLAEAHAYNQLLNRGEVGLQRPLGSTVAGVDAITAHIVYDAKGRPTDAKIFLNDVTTPDTLKGPKASHAAWHREMLAALGKRLDLGDPAVEAVLRKAAAQGNVFTRIVRVGYSAAGRVELSIRPSETRRVGARSAPSVFARLARVSHEDEEGLP